MNCPKVLDLIKQSQELHTQALVQIQQFSETHFRMRAINDLNIFTELRAINTEYENLKKQINENLKQIENLLQYFTHESYLTDLHPFMLETYKTWSYKPEQLKTVESVTSNPDNIHIDEDIPFDTFRAINLDKAKTEVNKSKTGELYLTSEQIDFENAKTFIPEIPDDIKAQGVSGVMKYIHETYKDTHMLPDLRYYKYLSQLSDQYLKETDSIKKEIILKQIPKQLRDDNKFFFPGCALVDEAGIWMSLYLIWNYSDGFYRNAYRIECSWNWFSGRIILLER